MAFVLERGSLWQCGQAGEVHVAFVIHNDAARPNAVRDTLLFKAFGEI